MERIIENVTPQKRLDIEIKNVCAYARVSSGKDAMLHSLSTQVSYYQDYIQSHKGWRFCGVYADEAITGTKGLRPKFREMLQECENGKIDLIITKSISRFARNTLTLLETIRFLKEKGVAVYFEEQNINTLSSDGEFMLTLLASYAQEESLSVSENMRWRIKKNFEQGKPWGGYLIGYKLVNGKYEIIPEEAVILRKIYQYYLEGNGVEKVARMLNQEGYRTRTGGLWNHCGITSALKNYSYTGNLILQKYYTENHLTKKTLINHGELPMYQAFDTHDAIVPLDVFEKVQKIFEEKNKKFRKPQPSKKCEYPFSTKLICSCCGKTYRRKVTPYNIIWQCNTFSSKGKGACPTSKSIPDSTLREVSARVLGMNEFDERLFKECVLKIIMEENNTLHFYLADGREVIEHWKDHSRSESWTAEMREQVSIKSKEMHRKRRCQK